MKTKFWIQSGAWMLATIRKSKKNPLTESLTSKRAQIFFNCIRIKTNETWSQKSDNFIFFKIYLLFYENIFLFGE